MDLTETESFCSSNSSDILPKDYSLSSTTIRESEDTEHKISSIKSMELSFGVDRLLAKCDKIFERKSFDENLLRMRLNENFSYSNGFSKNMNDLRDNHLNQNDTAYDEISNQNFVLKPFPLRLGRNENGKRK